MTAHKPIVTSTALQTGVQLDAPPALTDDRLRAPIDGHQLRGNTLAELVRDQTTLLVFLRHFG